MSRKSAQPEPIETQEEARQRITTAICDLIAEGQSLNHICSAVPGMPKKSTFLYWMAENSELADQYAQARDVQSDTCFDALQNKASEIVKLRLSEGWEPKDAISMAKLEVDTEKWRLSKLQPRKYGDRIIAEVADVTDYSSMSEEQLKLKIAALHEKITLSGMTIVLPAITRQLSTSES
jgi:hypothetical protein